MAGIHFHPQQDMARDKERPHLDVILDNQYLVLKGTGPDVDPATLSGHLRLFLTEATSLKEITLQFKGKAKIPVLTSDSYDFSSFFKFKC
jgi:arrestin-related trafficking adapter 4/5/7